MKRIPSYGDLITTREFLDAVTAGSLIDYDGHGYWSDGEVMDETRMLKPSQMVVQHAPEWATHVVWFNK